MGRRLGLLGVMLASALLVACGGRSKGDGNAAAGEDSGGGASGGSGSGGSGGGDSGGASSAAASVEFQLVAWQPDGGTPVDYCEDCGSALTILDAQGQPVELSDFCDTDCTTCRQAVCPPVAACIPQHLPSNGLHLSWDGSFYTRSTCGDVSCSQPRHAATGSRWTARLCAHASADASSLQCMSVGSPRCVDVPFTFPSDEPVVGVLYPTR